MEGSRKLDKAVNTRFEAPAMLVDHAHLKHELLDGGFTELTENLVIGDLLRHFRNLVTAADRLVRIDWSR